MKIYAIILAAGASTRMGTHKADLPWLDRKTLLTYQIDQWLAAGIPPIAVLNPTQTAPACQTVINLNPSRGKVSSILLGLAAVPTDCESIAIAAVDQPRPAEIYRHLIRTYQQHHAPITAPTYQGHLGHPLFFRADLRSHLLQIREETFGLRQIVEQFSAQIQRVEWQDQVVLADLNTPDAYQRWYLHAKKT
jgi:molybdenum cofactor cytidylyltransferase